MPYPNTIKLAIAEDSDLMRDAMVALLRKLDFDVVTEARNGRELTEKLRSPLPDIVLMDISMPVMDGIEATAWVKKHYPHIMVVALTMMSDEQSMIRMMKAGARAFLGKHISSEELLAALNNVYLTGYHLNEQVAEGMITVPAAKPSALFNDRETEMWAHLSTSMSIRDIARMLHISPRTVESRCHDMCKKTGTKGRIELVLWAVKHGIIEV